MNEIAIKNCTRNRALFLKMSGAILFALLTMLAAQVRIPLAFTPIPVTLQTLIVPLAGAFLGAFWGTVSMLLLMTLGVAGFQVLSTAPQDPTFFLSPTSGYILGFVAAAGLMGRTQDQRKGPLVTFFALLVSHLMIFACGVAGLLINTSWAVSKAVSKGVVPFLPGDVVKIGASYLILLSYSKASARWRGSE
ncbi:biotin transporter BioY [bacterium]|nr:biotin transporter BioY [bacterium]MCI0606958.1 biotin transporter BioY [bacterium]